MCGLPIKYTMFPKEEHNSRFDRKNPRGTVMTAYTFEHNGTILGALSPERRVRPAAHNLDAILTKARSLDLLEASASQASPADELADGSAFCYFGPTQKKNFLNAMMDSDWESRVFFASEQASYTPG